MSWACCQQCGRFINTDDEPEAYDNTTDDWLCEACRDEQALHADEIT